jgi:DNA-binding transcriptional ArsR family regulator
MYNKVETNLPEVKILNCISHSTRLAILCQLYQDGPLNVGQVRDKLNIEQSQTTRHLGKLFQAKILKRERIGKNVVYSLNFPGIERFLECINCLETE